MPVTFYESLFNDDYFLKVAKLYDVKIITFDENTKKIVEWKK